MYPTRFFLLAERLRRLGLSIPGLSISGLSILGLSFLMLVLLVLGLGAQQLQAQAWRPAQADTTWPRLYLPPGEVPALRDSLQADPVRERLYADVYKLATRTLSTANNSRRQREQRSQQAKCLAFVLYVGLEADTTTHTLTGDTLSSARRSQLEQDVLRLFGSDIHTGVTPLTLTNVTGYGDWQYTARDLNAYLGCYDLLKGLGWADSLLNPGRARLEQLVANLYAEAQAPNIALNNFWSLVVNNHSIKCAATLGLAAVILNTTDNGPNGQNATDWLNCALWYIDDGFWRNPQRQSEPDTQVGYAEGPKYLRYALQPTLTFFHALNRFLPDTTLAVRQNGQTRNIRHPYYDPRYQRLYDWMWAILLPNGKFPPFEDSFTYEAPTDWHHGGQERFLINPWPNNPDTVLLRRLSTRFGASYIQRVDFLSRNIRMRATQPARPYLTALPAAGNLVVRTDSTPGALYVHLLAEHGRALERGDGHDQGDNTSLSLWAHGFPLLLDPGYISWNDRNRVNHGEHHNLYWVDGQCGPARPNSLLREQDPAAYVAAAHQWGDLVHGTVESRYCNTDVRRDLYVLDSQLVVLVDRLQADRPADFTGFLHGNGLAGGNQAGDTFEKKDTNRTAHWRVDSTGLLATVAATDSLALWRTRTAEHETFYAQTDQHTVLEYGVEASEEAAFILGLTPTGRPDTLQIETERLDTFDNSLVRLAWANDGRSWEVWSPAKRITEFYGPNLAEDETRYPIDKPYFGEGGYGFLESDAHAILALQDEQDTLGEGVSFWFEGTRETNLSPIGTFRIDTANLHIWAPLESSNRFWLQTDGTGVVELEMFPVIWAPDTVVSPEWNQTTWSTTPKTQSPYARYLRFNSLPGLKLALRAVDTVYVSRSPQLSTPLNLYPNPAADLATLELPRGANWRLLDLMGRVLDLPTTREPLDNDRDRVRLQTRDLAPGLYLLEVTEGAARRTLRLVVQ